MLIGFNNDVDYRGKTFHIQTEDHGEGDPRIETQLFFSGAILDTCVTDYGEILEAHDGQEADERIRAQMKASHKKLYKNLMAGQYDEYAGLDPLDKDQKPTASTAQDFTPSQERVPEAAARVEEGGEDAIAGFQKKQAKNHVSLDTLKDHLSNISTDDDPDEPAASLEVDDDAAPTEVIEAGANLEISSVVQEADGSANQTHAGLIEYDKTGVRAWTGCRPANNDLSLTGLVENFLGL